MVAVAAAPVASAARPTLRVVDRSPLTVKGERFHSRENVLLTLTAGRTRIARHARATPAGSFVVSFGKVSIDVCAGYVVRAVGSRGSSAILRSPPILCPPRPGP